MKIGKMTYPGIDIVEEIRKAKNLDFDFVEIGIETPTDASVLRKNKKAILKLLKKFSYPSIGHTAWWYDLSSPYENVRKAWVDQGKTDIEIASELGIRLVNFHFIVLSSVLLRNKKLMKVPLENYVKSLNELARFAGKKGITIMLENGTEDLEYYKYVLDKSPKIKAHFDTGHAFMSGGMDKIEKFIFYFRERIDHVHFSDNHGKSDEHLGMGKGTINWRDVVSMLKYIGYDKTITFEVFTSEKELIRSREYIRKLWKKVK